jgi:hypothetical protein
MSAVDGRTMDRQLMIDGWRQAHEAVDGLPGFIGRPGAGFCGRLNLCEASGDRPGCGGPPAEVW